MAFLNPIHAGARVVALRPAFEHDRELLYRIYAAAREEELAPVPWSAEQKESFFRMQFKAQDDFYRQNYPNAEFDVIVVDGTDAGRIYLDSCPGDLRMMDIALLPFFRRQGIGGALIQAVLERAASMGAKVSIHVESFNPARRLYARLGFVEVGRDQVYLAMDWHSASPAGSTSGGD